LMAMGLSGERSRSSVRFSLGKANTEQEVDRVIEVLPQVLRQLRRKFGFAETEASTAAHR